MTTKEFVEKLNKDVELYNKSKMVKTREKLYELAKSNGVTCDFDTFINEFKKCLEPYRNMTEKDVEITAAGGLFGGNCGRNTIPPDSYFFV